jgi:hypothetical protein
VAFWLNPLYVTANTRFLIFIYFLTLNQGNNRTP